MDDPQAQPELEDHRSHAGLACQECQRKKIKCDRTFPCGQCRRSSLKCAPSTRKQRARNVKRPTHDSELRKRLAKLETLVEKMSGDSIEVDHTVEVPESTEVLSESATVPTGKFLGAGFWLNLTREVQALSSLLEEEDSDNEHEDPFSAAALGNEQSEDFDFIISPPNTVYVMPGALEEPRPHVAQQLFDVFLANVDPVFKVFHIPTLQGLLRGRREYLGHPVRSSVMKALESSLWFSAVNTLTEEECVSRFTMRRADLLHRYRRSADVAFSNADLINTTDLLLVQAYVVYLASSRTSDPSRRFWTLVPLIVRIAIAINVHQENPRQSAFEREMRRRLWNLIRALDAYAAVDRGTEPLVRAGTYTTVAPSNTNDADFDESSESIPHRMAGITEMTYSLLINRATALTIHLLLPEPDHLKHTETWQQRLEKAYELGRQIRGDYLKYCDLSVPFHRFLYHCGETMISSAAVRAIRPIQRHVSSTPPRVDSPFVLQMALNCLRESENIDNLPEARAWRWMFWVQWHALAVALAGLCFIRETELSNEAWLYVDRAFDRYSKKVADSKTGMLWRPIEKLYKKAQAFRLNEDMSPLFETKSDPRAVPQQSSASYSNAASVVHENNRTLSVGSIIQYQNIGAYPLTALGETPASTDGLNNSFPESIDLGNSSCGFHASPYEGVDMIWTDWEQIMADMSSNPSNVPLSPNQLQMLQQLSGSFDVKGPSGGYPYP